MSAAAAAAPTAGRSQFMWPQPGLPRVPADESLFLKVGEGGSREWNPAAQGQGHAQVGAACSRFGSVCRQTRRTYSALRAHPPPAPNSSPRPASPPPQPAPESASEPAPDFCLVVMHVDEARPSPSRAARPFEARLPHRGPAVGLARSRRSTACAPRAIGALAPRVASGPERVPSPAARCWPPEPAPDRGVVLPPPAPARARWIT
jgi:hypothetical protein